MNDAARKLTIEEANRIAREELEITTLEPRDNREEDFHTLAVWEIETVMERAYRAGFEAATVPVDTKPEELLTNAFRENLSPHAVAAIAAYLQPVRTMDPEVVRQLQWFAELLTTVVGGEDELNRLCEEVGL